MSLSKPLKTCLKRPAPAADKQDEQPSSKSVRFARETTLAVRPPLPINVRRNETQHTHTHSSFWPQVDGNLYFAYAPMYVTLGSFIAFHDRSIVTILNTEGNVVRCIYVGQVTLLFGLSMSDTENFVFYLRKGSLFRLNILSRREKPIFICPEHYPNPTIGASFGKLSVVVCGVNDLIVMDGPTIKSWKQFYDPVTAVACNLHFAFIITGGNVQVFDKKLNEVCTLLEASRDFTPTHLAANGDTLLMTNGTKKGIVCNFSIDQAAIFRSVELPFAAISVAPYLQTFACTTSSGIQVCVFFLSVCVCAPECVCAVP